MNIERFEDVLRYKFDRGIHTFVGRRTGCTYLIQHFNSSRHGYTLFKDGNAICAHATFFKVACTIYDYEHGTD